MDRLKSKNNSQSLRFYWHFFIPLTVILSLMIFFPLRIALDELLLDTIFYGVIMLACIISAIRIYLRFRRRSYRLVGIILLCILLSGWQVFDLAILRNGRQTTWIYDTSYEPRFKNDEIRCHTISERYFGNDLIAIAYNINWQDSWGGCGG